MLILSAIPVGLGSKTYEELEKSSRNLVLPEAEQFRLGSTLFREGDKKSAANAYRIFSINYPHSPLAADAQFMVAESIFYRAVYQLRTGIASIQEVNDPLSFSNAIKQYKKIISKYEKSGMVDTSLFRIAECYYNLRDYKSALKYFLKVQKNYPDSYLLYESIIGAVQCHLFLGNHSAADLGTSKLLKLSPDHQYDKRVITILEIINSVTDKGLGFIDSVLSNMDTILPGRIRLARAPIKVFYPLREILAFSPNLIQEIGTGWKMVVTDSEDRPFRRFKVRNLPPGILSWNGRSNEGQIVSVGKIYSVVISYIDSRGQWRNFAGEPFVFEGVIHEEPRGPVISLALTSLFEPKRGYNDEEIIGESGFDLLNEAADWIRRYYFTYPVRVDCYSTDPVLATARAQVVSKFLKKILILPRPEISAGGFYTDVNNERVEIVINVVKPQ